MTQQILSPHEPKQKPPIEPQMLAHRELLTGSFWRKIPAYRTISEATFLDHRWQAQQSVTNLAKLRQTLQGLVKDEFFQDVQEGLHRSPMGLRVSPYLISLIQWEDPYTDPLRTQFIPLGSRLLPEHPCTSFDSLHEQYHTAVPGLIHRYVDRGLFLPLDICPVYCRFCTRSYAVGTDTEQLEKMHFNTNLARWQQAYNYIASRPELEDVLVSGGDVYQLRPEHLQAIGEELLRIPHVQRIRFATKGPATMPQKILTDQPWTEALLQVVKKGRKLSKEVMVHTHFNHPSEITSITQRATHRLFQEGVTLRNQTVLQWGVNDHIDTLSLLIKRLSYIHVHPYYVFLPDLVKGIEDLRLSLHQAIHLEKELRGVTAGFNTPTFVCDLLGGGGKRDIHSYEYYDRNTGISVYVSPALRPGNYFFYFDPLHSLHSSIQERWLHPTEQQIMMADALKKAKEGALSNPLSLSRS
ncbi:KamA family radical SAM protein [Pajaroellobacter abortibovis]|uniref:Lysine 2,3-aminomutase n=1 Tax=Pajaroellobacter abortibovis TaxID=1882918 RepID=A0A1L6MYM5_9BACT|nr:KamA family radical SAM protein [Pajaroellobacter abortibovis]APS00518.1 lysine 2,3-aminomutase [Pajaroellobacter abortibovis]